jgi:hypothetical protein
VDSIAHGLRWGADLLIRPFEGLGPLGVIIAISLITGVMMLLVVRWTSPQRAIERARGQIAAAIYEVRLFLDSPLRVIKAQGRMLRSSAIYIGALLPALVVMSLPMGLLYLQLDLRYGFEPVPVGEPVVVEVAVDGDPSNVSVDAGTWGEITGPPVRDVAGGSVYFRLVIAEPGTHELAVVAGGDRVTKRIVAEAGATTSPVRVSGASLWWAPTDEPPLSGQIRAISVDQRAVTLDLLGMPWWLLWLILATVAALALRRPLGVTL